MLTSEAIFLKAYKAVIIIFTQEYQCKTDVYLYRSIYLNNNKNLFK